MRLRLGDVRTCGVGDDEVVDFQGKIVSAQLDYVDLDGENGRKIHKVLYYSTLRIDPLYVSDYVTLVRLEARMVTFFT